MLGMLLLTAALVAVCFSIGHGVLAVCGSARWRWWAPSLGYAVLLIVGGQVLRIPNHLTAMVAMIVAAAILAMSLRLVRRAVLEAGPDAALLGALVLVLAAIPFLATGRVGVLGATWSDDMSQHLTAAFYLRTGASLRPIAAFGGDLISTGYPLGAHGLAALLTKASGLGEERSFAAITLAIPVLTAFTALGIVPAARRAARWALAAIVGLGYLPAAYLAQGSFKETTEALLVLAVALALGDLAREEPPRGLRRGVPIGLLAGGAVYNYSYGGVVWIAAIAAALLAAAVARDPRSLPAILRRAAVPAVAAVVVAAVVLAPEIGRIEAFANSVFGVEPKTQHGNLIHALNPLETVGVWFSGDFRLYPRPEWPSVAFDALGVAALLGGLGWWWRRRAAAMPAAVVASLGIWIYLALTRNTYNAAKGLVVLAPVAIGCIGGPLAAAWSERGRTERMRRAILAARGAGLALLGAAAVSTLGQLRSAPVGLGSHEQELAAMRPLLRGKPVLFLASDNFAQWELRGARLYVTSKLYPSAYLDGHPQKYGGLPADVDNYESSELDKLDFILTPGGPYRSEIPPNFKLVMHTPSYELYRRIGPTPVREPLEPPGQPGTVFDCGSPVGKQYLARYRWAGVLPTPVLATGWHGSIGVPGHSARIRVELPPGRWDVSLQYVSFTALVIRGPDLHDVIAPDYGTIAAYWPAGTLSTDGRPFTLSASSQNRSWFGRLIGAPRPVLAGDSPKGAPIWHVAFTRHGVSPERVPVREACGRYVDWFAPAGSAMH